MRQPAYQKIKHSILEQIEGGSLKPEDRIPSEHKLAAHHGVSRLTVQRAVRELVAEGFLRRAQGSGTFVTAGPHRFSLLEVRDVVEEIRALGGEPQSEVLMQRRYAPGPEICRLLEIDDEAEVFHAAIVQSLEDEPIAYEERWALPDVYSDFLEQDFSRTSVFAYFASRSVLGEIETQVSAVSATPRLAQQLGIEESEPCIQVQRRNWYQERCVTLTRITYAGVRQMLVSRYQPFTQDARKTVRRAG